MALTNVWLAGYGGPAVGATAVWIAPNDGTVPAATQVTLVGWNGPVSGATPIWIAGYGGPPAAAIGAIPICIKGWSGSGGSGGGGGATSVWSASDAAANGMTLSNGGLTVVATTSVWQSCRGSISRTAGKYYVEFLCMSSPSSNASGFGIADASFAPTSYLGSNNYSMAFSNSGGVSLVSPAGFSGALTGSPHLPVLNDVMQIAVDLTAGKVWYGINNVWVVGGNPAAGTGELTDIVAPALGIAFFPAMSVDFPTSGTWTLQPTPASQKYLPPPGFQAWDGGPVTPSTSVWSASDATAGGMTLTNGGLTVTSPAGGWLTVRTTISKTAGKLYVEFLANTSTGSAAGQMWGLADATFLYSEYLGQGTYSAGFEPSGSTYVSAGFTSNYSLPSSAVATNDVWALAVDFAGKVWIARNNVWVNGSNPATASLPIVSFVQATVGALFAGISFNAPGQVWTLQSTAASQKYAPPSGFTPWDGGVAPTHSPQALAYLARTVGGNEGGNGANIATLIDGLVSDGVWAKLDALYVLAQQNATDALLNLVGTNYTATNSGGATFVAYQGYHTFPAAGLPTGFNPTVGSPQYAQNSASAGVWAYSVAAESGEGIADDINLQIYVKYIDGNFYPRINNTSMGGLITPGTSGLYVADRSSSANVVPYWDGAAQTTVSGTSSALTSGVFAIGKVTNETICAAFIGASLGSAGQLALYTRLRTYMTAIGVP